MRQDVSAQLGTPLADRRHPIQGAGCLLTQHERQVMNNQHLLTTVNHAGTGYELVSEAHDSLPPMTFEIRRRLGRFHVEILHVTPNWADATEQWQRIVYGN